MVFLEHLIAELEKRGRSATKQRIALRADRLKSLADRLESLAVADEIEALERKRRAMT